MDTSARKLVLALPPFSLLPASRGARIKRRSWVLLHFVTLGLLYGLVFVAAAYERVIHLHSGIGIIQNPPFLAHVVCGIVSMWLPLVIANRIVTATTSTSDEAVFAEFLQLVQASRTKVALFAIAFLIGLASLASTVVLSVAPTVDIYDSMHHPLTFVAYFIVRVYLYLICYPFMMSGTVVTVYYLFRALRNSTAVYRPFHDDEMGGFRKYWHAVDSPVYLVQSLTVLVGTMNYFGWGGMFTIPLVFSVAAPTIVSGFAFILLYGFHRLLKFKKEQEVRAIRQQQMAIYPEAKRLSSLSPAEGLELLKRIEAMDALIATIRRGRQSGWEKYLLNVAVVIVGQIAKFLPTLLANRIRGVP